MTTGGELLLLLLLLLLLSSLQEQEIPDSIVARVWLWSLRLLPELLARTRKNQSQSGVK